MAALRVFNSLRSEYLKPLANVSVVKCSMSLSHFGKSINFLWKEIFKAIAVLHPSFPAQEFITLKDGSLSLLAASHVQT